MNSLLMKLLSATLCATISIGCEPQPVVDKPDSNSAVDVNVNRDGIEVERDRNGGDSAVEVQVGGGQGVQVEVDSKPDSN